MFVIPQDEFGQFTEFNLRTLHYYKINNLEVNSLPRLDMLISMTEDFPYQPVSKLALRITDD